MSTKVNDPKPVYTLITSIEDDVITQGLSAAFSNLIDEITLWVYDTKEQALRDALIILGWKPPKDNKGINDVHLEEKE